MVCFLGQEYPLEEGMATHSSILVWRFPMDRGARRTAVHSVTELDTTEVTEYAHTNQGNIPSLGLSHGDDY